MSKFGNLKFRLNVPKSGQSWQIKETTKSGQSWQASQNVALCDWICMVKWWSTQKVFCNSVVVCPNYCQLKRTLFCQNPRFGTLRFGTLVIFIFFWKFKYIFLSSRYIDSDHFCRNLCCRLKPGSIPMSVSNSFISGVFCVNSISWRIPTTSCDL